MNDSAVTIAGGGLSGLAAALAVAHRGRAAHVFERRRDLGARFHGDVHECREGCDCTYCRCAREAAGQDPVDDTSATNRSVSEAAHVSAVHRKAC
jgi:predicted NAD/FAD-dependent oxidoreductase